MPKRRKFSTAPLDVDLVWVDHEVFAGEQRLILTDDEISIRSASLVKPLNRGDKEGWEFNMKDQYRRLLEGRPNKLMELGPGEYALPGTL